jgi:adenine-specific DNA-methyltransferase
MRYIGNKVKLVELIFNEINKLELKEKVICDLFSGTTTVAKFFKEKGWKVFTSDLLYFSYCLQRAYIQNNEPPTFKGLIPSLITKTDALFSNPLDLVIEFLDQLPLKKGFIYNNYTLEGTKTGEIERNFFSGYNGQKIDTYRSTIEDWHLKNLITENEYYILITLVIETAPFYANISGVYGAFLKSSDPRALKPMRLKNIKLLSNDRENLAYCGDGLNFIQKINTEVLYLDPPYNHRQYAPNYHLLETIARYDNPEIKGVAGIRPYKDQKSLWCNKVTAVQSLNETCKSNTFKYLVLSYNSEGVMTVDEILDTLNQYGLASFIEIEYLRYKSNNNGDSKHKKYVKELLFILKKN